MPREIIDKNLADELIDQAHFPPGKDPCLGSFYSAAVQLADAEEPLAYILATVKQQRSDLTDKHLVNLFFRAVQSIKFDEGDLNYRYFREAAPWKEELRKITTGPQSKRFREILHQRSTNTTIYQRYAGPYAVISYLYDGNGATIADLGCGGNYGLRGFELCEPFQPIVDQTPNFFVTTFLNSRINIQKGLAIDKENPDTSDNIRWRLACSLYPQELDQLPALQEFEKRIRESQRVKFMQANLLKSTDLPVDSYDVVILSTILYQLQRHEQTTLLEKARSMLNEQGIVIVQDFAVRDPERVDQLDFGESWFGKEFSYNTFVTGKAPKDPFREALNWNNGRSRVVRPGQDFYNIFPLAQLSTTSAALAQSTS